MVDPDTFLTTLYVIADDFCKSQWLTLPMEREPGPTPFLSLNKVVTLAIFGQWTNFESELDFYRYAKRHLVRPFPPHPIAAS
jgi:hypothetical protein